MLRKISNNFSLNEIKDLSEKMGQESNDPITRRNVFNEVAQLKGIAMPDVSENFDHLLDRHSIA